MNSNKALPTPLQEYFDASNRRFTEVYKPTWLMNEFDAPVWNIAFGHNVREVVGKIVGAARISWQLQLPNGRLSDPIYERLLNHSKLLFVATYDSSAAPSRSIAGAVSYHRFLMWLVEYWVIYGPGEHFDQGLEGLDVDAVVDFLSLYAACGTAGVGRFCERWDEWVIGRSSELRTKVEAFMLTLSEEEYQQTVLPVIKPPMIETDFDPVKITTDLQDLRLARGLLYMENAYNSRGLLRAQFVAAALNMDARRVRSIATFEYHLRQYERCNDYQFREYPHLGVRTAPVGTRPSIPQMANRGRDVGQLANWIIQTSRTLSSIPALATCTFADPREVEEKVYRFRKSRPTRTRTIPIDVGLRLVGKCLEWMDHTAPSLLSFIEAIAENAKGRSGNLANVAEAAFFAIPMPRQLERYDLKGFWGKSAWEAADEGAVFAADAKGQLSLGDLISVHSAVCFVLMAMLSCSRREEMRSLTTDDLIIRGDRAYFNVALRKVGVDEARTRMLKPVPLFIANCMRSMININRHLAVLAPISDPYVRRLIFVSFNRNGLSELNEELYRQLDMLSIFIDLRTANGNIWFIRPHELRRLFALTFFHSGGRENALPALSWFMGHNELHITWRYIREELTGAEISDTEATLARAAVYSSDQSASVCQLRKMLLRHFGVSELKVLSDETVQDYLEMLHEDGVYTATPVQIRTADGKRFTVLITVDGY